MSPLVLAVEPAFLSAGTVRAAAALARLLEAPLVVAGLPSDGRPDRRDAAEGLEEALRLAREKGVEVIVRHLEGDPEKALVACVRETGAGIVVFADDPESTRIEGLTAALIRSLPAALLLVRDPEPLVAWAHGEQALRTLLAMDFSACSRTALSWILGLRARAPVDLELLHVSWLPGQRRRLGMTTPEDPRVEEAEVRRVLLREMAGFVGDAPEVRCAVRLSLGRTADALAFAAAEREAELVVVGTRQRHGLSRLWHGSVAGGVLTEVRTNVAVVPVSSPIVQTSGNGPLPRVRTVLAATDFSENGDRTVLRASTLLTSGGTVHLVHVVDPGLPVSAEAEILQRLQALECPAAVEAGVILVPEVLRSRNPAEALCARAERLGADVVCVGYRGRTGLGWGSVSDAVLRLSDRPVLVVKQEQGGHQG